MSCYLVVRQEAFWIEQNMWFIIISKSLWYRINISFEQLCAQKWQNHICIYPLFQLHRFTPLSFRSGVQTCPPGVLDRGGYAVPLIIERLSLIIEWRCLLAHQWEAMPSRSSVSAERSRHTGDALAARHRGRKLRNGQCAGQGWPRRRGARGARRPKPPRRAEARGPS